MATPEQSAGPSEAVNSSAPTADKLSPAADSLSPSNRWSQLGFVEHAVLAVGWLSCVVLAWVPLVVAVLLLGLVVVSMIGSYSLLRVGGFAATDQRFLQCCVLGLIAAAVVMVGVLLRYVFRPKGSRERVFGPGGRVLRAILHKPTENPKGVLSQIPDASSMLVTTLLIVSAHVWLVHRPVASAGAVALIIANLLVWSLYWSVGVFRLGGQLAWGLHRLARSGRYVAGFISALLLVSGVYIGWSWVHFIDWAKGQASTAMERTDVEESVSATAPPLAPRTFLFSIAESFWPELATDAGVRHLIVPLLVKTETVSPDEVALLIWDGLPRYAQYGGFVSADEAAAPAFKLCIEKLYPGQVSRVKKLPSFRQYRLDDDSEHDALLGAVLAICENHAMRTPYDDLVRVLERAAVNAAIDITRRNKRIVLSDEDAGYFERCPNRFEAPDHRLAAEQELARVKWSELRPIQKAIILEKAVLELDDDEIAAHHSPMTKRQVKNAYQNSIRKIQEKLITTCPSERL